MATAGHLALQHGEAYQLNINLQPVVAVNIDLNTRQLQLLSFH
jgi:hypothetical protein